MEQIKSHQNEFDPLLILVHPGSLCGSADFNLGGEALAAREAVINELNQWTGNIIVLDGELSDELERYRYIRLGNAIDDAVSRAPALGDRLEADDPEHAEIAVSYLADLKLPFDTPIFLTGAWYDPGNNSGCVNHTRDALFETGYTNVTVMQSSAIDCW
jgi:hypothetical protein